MNNSTESYWHDRAAELRHALEGKVPGRVEGFLREATLSEIARVAGGPFSHLSENSQAAVVATVLAEPLPKTTFASPLRERIQATIEASGPSPEAAAIAVCELLEWDLSLAGNGWWDDDEVMQRELDKAKLPPFRGTA